MDLARTVSQSLDIAEDTVDRVLTEYAKAIMVHMVFAGPIDTVFGRLAYSAGKIDVIQQNVKTLKLIGTKPTTEELLTSMSDLLLEKTDDPSS